MTQKIPLTHTYSFLLKQNSWQSGDFIAGGYTEEIVTDLFSRFYLFVFFTVDLNQFVIRMLNRIGRRKLRSYNQYTIYIYIDTGYGYCI